MSHQTGIQASAELVKFLAQAKNGTTRLVKMHIENESIVLEDHRDEQGTWDQDYNELVTPLLKDKEPCYMLYKLDTSNNQGREWLFISYSPDDSKVNQKMLYAATRATLKTTFGVGHILDELFGTHQDDLTLSAYEAHKRCGEAPPPLTNAEFEKQLQLQTESHSSVGIHTKHSTLPGINFDIEEKAMEALQSLKSGDITYIQLTINLEKEIITFVSSDTCSVHDLPGKVPNDAARYHLFNFKHTHEGDSLDSIVMIYSMPGYSCSVKERMLFSSSISPFVDTCEQHFGIKVEKRVEIAEGSELTEDFLLDELHPKKILHRPQFSKPKPPPGRGAKRLVKDNK